MRAELEVLVPGRGSHHKSFECGTNGLEVIAHDDAVLYVVGETPYKGLTCCRQTRTNFGVGCIVQSHIYKVFELRYYKKECFHKATSHTPSHYKPLTDSEYYLMGKLALRKSP